MDYNKVLEFSASIGEYHYYKSLWNPIPNQKLKCTHEGNNPFNMFGIKICDDVKIVGHLPMEISRSAKYLLDRGAVFTVEVTSTNYRRSPLIQGGLEIPTKLTVMMSVTLKYRLLMGKYNEIVNERYAEPKDEEVLGSFLVLPPVGQACKRDTRSEKSTNGEGIPKKTITGKVRTSESFFVKSRKRTKARLTWL